MYCSTNSVCRRKLTSIYTISELLGNNNNPGLLPPPPPPAHACPTATLAYVLATRARLAGAEQTLLVVLPQEEEASFDEERRMKRRIRKTKEILATRLNGPSSYLATGETCAHAFSLAFAHHFNSLRAYCNIREEGRVRINNPFFCPFAAASGFPPLIEATTSCLPSSSPVCPFLPPLPCPPWASLPP